MKKPSNKKQYVVLSDREFYLKNRNNMIEDFDSSLKEVQRDEPSVGGKIAGMDFQQMSASTVFMLIIEQEEYIKVTKEYKPDYVDLKEEKELLSSMIKKAKMVFGDQYQTWYNNANKNR